MKKFLLSIFVFLASAVYVVYDHMGGSASTNQIAVTIPSNEPSPFLGKSPEPTPNITDSATPTKIPKPTTIKTAPTPTPKPKGQYKDGTYAGSVADAFYGMVQIQATIQNGKITAIDFLQYPNDRQTSQLINGEAMPLLKSEAIQAQSANVSGVSGATDTSQAFIHSLGDALTQAKN